MRKLSDTFSSLKKRILMPFIWKSRNLAKTEKWNSQNDTIFQSYVRFVNDMCQVKYSHYFFDIANVFGETTCKWVGGQIYKNVLLGVTNCESSIMEYDFVNEKFQKIGNTGINSFKWTGGCLRGDKFYMFPRSENAYIALDLVTKELRKYPLGYTYNGEHHYGGVCTNEGMVYQPPRNEDHILVFDLDDGSNRKIQLAPKWLNIKMRYCGSIIHPNGNAYFFPENKGKVIKLNLKTEEWAYIGNTISTMVFDAKVAVDGNIYGFSAYCPGMLRIDVNTDECKMIHLDKMIGAFGTKMGVNGNLYSVPGDGAYVWEYNPREDKLEMICKVNENIKAKFAGGGTGEDGMIFGVPAQETKILILKPSQYNLKIEKEVWETYFADNY